MILRPTFYGFFVFIIGLILLGSSCKKKPSCSKKKDVGKFYWGYKPMYTTTPSGTDEWVWQRCDCKEKITDIPGYQFVIGDIFSGTPLKGRHPDDNGTYATGNSQKMVSVAYHVNPNPTVPNVYKLHTDVLTYNPLYAHYKLKGSDCSEDYKCLPPDMIAQINNCKQVEKGVHISDLLCPNVSLPFDTKLLPDYNSQYDNNYIYPVLWRSENGQQFPYSDYVTDVNWDVEQTITIGGVQRTVNRYIYINVIIKNGATKSSGGTVDYNSKHKVVFKNVFTNTEQSVDLNGTNKPQIRFCENVDGEKRYVIQFKLNEGAGNYEASLYDMDKIVSVNCDGGSNSYDCVARTTVEILDFDTYPGNTLGDIFDRKIDLITLNYGSSYDISSWKVKAWNNLEESLEDAFSLPQKTKNEKNPSIKRGVDFAIKPCAPPVSVFTDGNGNIKIDINELERYISAPHNLSITEAYNRVLNDVYWNIFDVAYEYCPSTTPDDLTKAMVMVVNGFVLVDENGITLPTVNNETGGIVIGEEALSSPKAVFKDLLGKTGPYRQNVASDPLMELLTMALIIKKNHSVMLIAGNTLEEYAVITLIHELGHIWAHYLMVEENATNTNGSHNNYCGGYHMSSCVFRYGSAYTDYPTHNTMGVTYCESHRQIILNQLCRKVVR